MPAMAEGIGGMIRGQVNNASQGARTQRCRQLVRLDVVRETRITGGGLQHSQQWQFVAHGTGRDGIHAGQRVARRQFRSVLQGNRREEQIILPLGHGPNRRRRRRDGGAGLKIGGLNEGVVVGSR